MKEYEFRERVTTFLGGGKEDKSPEDSFCEVCRAAKKNVNCSTCTKQLQELDAPVVKSADVEQYFLNKRMNGRRR